MGKRKKCRALNKIFFQANKGACKTPKKRKNKHVWNYKAQRSSFHTHKAECPLFVAAVSRSDKNLKAASWSRDQILNPLTLKRVWDFYSKVTETAHSALCHENTKRARVIVAAIQVQIRRSSNHIITLASVTPTCLHDIALKKFYIFHFGLVDNIL